MAFYTDISVVYDDLFPVSPEQRAMLESLREAGGVRSVVDCGCGTGAQLMSFATAGLSCLGFDPDPSLVAIARRKLATYPKTRIEQGAFADLRRITSFPSDLLLCLGNSLVHVPGEEAGRFLSAASAVLSPGGTLLLQTLNYQRLFRERATELPLIRSRDGSVEFHRRYQWESERKVLFRTSLRFPSAGEPRVIRNEIVLHPLYPEELREMLASAGFIELRFFGDFARADFHPGSEALVCLARKA
ncbi:MAG: class I SAM-dependent methyltransferase [Deltaproteobacteria bacterium]|nr:class I SAM-dependent methyltransferase [Deltaproteobacteria bacterium]